jgi:conjugal transfer pilus assembly protein TraW
MQIKIRFITGSLFFVMIITSINLFAKNLGTVGQTYFIQEEDLLSFIERRITTMQNNGEWQHLNKDIQSRVSQHIDRPIPLTHIKKTTSPQSWAYDPSIIVPYDLHDTQGNVFAKAGTRVNPLTMVTLHTALAFYDANDEEEVKWARKINQQYAGKIKFVLVNGSISSQEKILAAPIYFDQEGRLTSRFHIKHVPALVYQEGLHLKIEEVLP